VPRPVQGQGDICTDHKCTHRRQPELDELLHFSLLISDPEKRTTPL
jgi:hypothetical protein